MNAPETAIVPAATDIFITVPEVTLPNGTVVPSFQVGQYAAAKSANGTVTINAEDAPWVRINFADAKKACADAGYTLITELQWLAIAHDVAGVDANWTKGKVGEGKLFLGLCKANVTSAQAGTYESPDAKERRWLTLSNGERICDLNGNVFQWVFDNVQGDEKGLTGTIKVDSISLQAPYPSCEKGMGWRPDYQANWSGYALIRGGYWVSGSDAGAFRLSYDWPGGEGGDVGFRCTKPGL